MEPNQADKNSSLKSEADVAKQSPSEQVGERRENKACNNMTSKLKRTEEPNHIIVFAFQVELDDPVV